MQHFSNLHLHVNRPGNLRKLKFFFFFFFSKSGLGPDTCICNKLQGDTMRVIHNPLLGVARKPPYFQTWHRSIRYYLFFSLAIW